MWSVWSKALDIYVGHGLAMLRANSGDPVVLRAPATFPLDRILSALIESSGENIAAGRTIRLYFSGTMCPALGVAAPKEVTRWQERQAIAHAMAAKALGFDANEIDCEMDPVHPGIAAAVPIGRLKELQGWAHQQGARIVSVEPLWAVATQCHAARHRTVRSLILLEPGAVTMLACDGKGGFDGLTLPGQIDAATLTAHTRRWLVGHGLTEEDSLRIGFGDMAKPAMPGGPKPWSAHWYRP